MNRNNCYFLCLPHLCSLYIFIFSFLPKKIIYFNKISMFWQLEKGWNAYGHSLTNTFKWWESRADKKKIIKLPATLPLITAIFIYYYWIIYIRKEKRSQFIYFYKIWKLEIHLCLNTHTHTLSLESSPWFFVHFKLKNK